MASVLAFVPGYLAVEIVGEVLAGTSRFAQANGRF
jgi:hypothetical protein